MSQERKPHGSHTCSGLTEVFFAKILWTSAFTKNAGKLLQNIQDNAQAQQQKADERAEHQEAHHEDQMAALAAAHLIPVCLGPVASIVSTGFNIWESPDLKSLHCQLYAVYHYLYCFYNVQ
jgi:hypothetical protein